MMETWHPLGVGRRDLRVQLPRRGVGVECGARAGLRRQRRLEAVARRRRSPRSPCQALFERARREVRRRAGRPLARSSSACATPARRWRRRRASRSSAPPARRAWAATSAPRVAARFGRSHPRTRRQQRDDRRAERPISISPCAPSCSPPSAPRASAAPRCAGCSCTTASTTSSCRALKKAYASLRIGNPLETGTLVGPLIDRRAFEAMQTRARRKRRARRRHGHRRRARARRQLCPTAYYVAPRDRRDAGADADRLPRDLRADPLCDALHATSTKRSRCTTPCRRACRPASSPTTCGRPSVHSRPPAPIAASPM